jgi:nucleotide-binding universal stress UspA family protein
VRLLHLGRDAHRARQRGPEPTSRGGAAVARESAVEPRPSAPEHLIAALDSSVERALVMAAITLPAWLIVVPRHAALGSWAARRVALCAGVPVLVASQLTTRGGIVAASDLADNLYPVLRRGAQLGQRLQTVVTFIHNLEADPERGVRTADERVAHALADKLTELRRAGRSIGLECPSVVMTRSDPEDAILDLAQRQRADMIVVGSRGHAPRTGPTHDSVAASVIERADRSVLVLPLTTRDRSRREPSARADTSHMPPELSQVEHDGWMPVTIRAALPE